MGIKAQTAHNPELGSEDDRLRGPYLRPREWDLGRRRGTVCKEAALRGCADSSLPGGTVAARVDESTAMTRACPSGKRVEFTRGGGRF